MDNNMKNTIDLSVIKDYDKTYPAYLLFDKEPTMPELLTIKNALIEAFSDVEVLEETEEATTFHVKKYVSYTHEGVKPTQIVLGKAEPFSIDDLSDIERTQFWNVKNSEEELSKITHKVLVSDFFTSLDYKEKAELIMDFVESMLEIFNECKFVYFPASGALNHASKMLVHDYPTKDRFVHFAVNVRTFNLETNQDRHIVDSLGMFALGLPEVQYYYKDYDLNEIVRHAFVILEFIFSDRDAIIDGDYVSTIEYTDETKWQCKLVEALVPPHRMVLNINTEKQ